MTDATTPTKAPHFKKLASGEWRVACAERIDVDGGHDVITVSMRDGTTKDVRLTRMYSEVDGEYLYIPVTDKRPATRRPVQGYRQDRYDTHRVLGVCADCEQNADSGDGRGCPRHRGNPRA